MLSPELTQSVRTAIASVLKREPADLAPHQRFFADLGGTPADLKPLREAIEAVVPVAIEPIVGEVNARTAVTPDGVLTQASLRQIVEYLGDWPGRPKSPGTFPDLFTIGMIEAIIARGLASPEPGVEPATTLPLLDLSPELRQRIHELVAEVYHLPPGEVCSTLPLPADEEDPLDFALVILKVRDALGVSLDAAFDEFRGLLEESTEGATPQTVERLKRFVPEMETTPDSNWITVGLIERLVSRAIEQREAPGAALSRPLPREPVGFYLADWKWDDQDWFASLPEVLGDRRYRLYLAGILRAAFLSAGTLNKDILPILEVIEKFAETGESPEALEKKHRAVSRWKVWRYPLWSGLQVLTAPVCTVEDGGGILARVAGVMGWTPAEARLAARQWLGSLIPPTEVALKIDPAWCTPDVMVLVRRMHDLRNFAEFPELGTLLQNAGCAVPDILDHCGPDRRHLRGDWLLTALLAAAPPGPAKGTRGKGKTSSGKTPKLPTLTARQKKELKELLVQYHAGVPLQTAWNTVLGMNHARHEASYRDSVPRLTPDVLKVLGALYPVRMVVSPDVAVVRRIQLANFRELHQALVLWSRLSLIIWNTRPYFLDLADYLRGACVANDEASMQWAVRVLPFRSEMEQDPHLWDYVALRQILQREESKFAEQIERWPHPAGSDRVRLLERGLLPILKRDRAGVAAALREMLVQERASAAPEGFRTVALTVHAVYHAARRLDPELVADFDVNETYPWDAGFHQTVETHADPLVQFDFSETPEILRDLILTQPIPDWLDQLQNSPRNQDRRVAVVITDVGPHPDAVFEQLVQVTDLWTREDFDLRTSRLPMTLLSSTSADSVSFLVDPLRKAGATIEVIKH